MTNTRTYVRLLRHLGIALIFAPEHFTTPFGVAFVLAARHLSRRHEASVNSRLRDTVQYYLAHTYHSGDYVDGESGAPVPMRRRTLNEKLPILGQITGSCNFGSESAVRQGRRDIQEHSADRTAHAKSLSRRCKYGNSLSETCTRTQKVVSHTADTEWLSRRYERGNGVAAYSRWATASGSMEGVTHHSVNMGSLSQRCGSVSVGQARAGLHATNTAQRQQRHGSAVSGATVLSAVQNNNYYYEILSRKNVIGGY